MQFSSFARKKVFLGYYITLKIDFAIVIRFWLLLTKILLLLHFIFGYCSLLYQNFQRFFISLFFNELQHLILPYLVQINSKEETFIKYIIKIIFSFILFSYIRNEKPVLLYVLRNKTIKYVK